MENWLEIAAGVYLLAMVLYGHYRGFIRLAVSLAALAAALLLANAAMPYVSVAVRENTPVRQWIAAGMEERFRAEEVSSGESETGPDAADAWIDRLDLPEDVRALLKDGEAGQAYLESGVDALSESIGGAFADLVIGTVGFVILFFVIYLLLRLIMNWLDLVARLPILSGMNHIAGAVLGGVQGLFFLWIAALVLMACSGTSWGAALIRQIEASPWLSFLYHYNLVSQIALGVIRGVILPG